MKTVTRIQMVQPKTRRFYDIDLQQFARGETEGDGRISPGAYEVVVNQGKIVGGLSKITQMFACKADSLAEAQATFESLHLEAIGDGYVEQTH